MVAALGLGGPVAAAWTKGAYNGEKFLAWVTDALCPQLRKGDVVVLDNVRFHHRAEVRAAVREAKADVRFLPPYSPDLNPIEKMWSKAKALLRGRRAADPGGRRSRPADGPRRRHPRPTPPAGSTTATHASFREPV